VRRSGCVHSLAWLPQGDGSTWLLGGAQDGYVQQHYVLLYTCSCCAFYLQLCSHATTECAVKMLVICTVAQRLIARSNIRCCHRCLSAAAIACQASILLSVHALTHCCVHIYVCTTAHCCTLHKQAIESVACTVRSVHSTYRCP
jgi:hypothetical protein